MTHSQHNSWQCTGGRNGKAFHSSIEVSSEKCPICGEPYDIEQQGTKKQIPPALTFILVIDLIIIVIGAFAYFIWFRGCPSGQEKIGGKCIAKVSPQPSPDLNPDTIIKSDKSIISASPASPSPSPQPTPTPPTADQTWQKIQQQIQAPNRQLAEIDQVLTSAENEFPNDYRFTYERVRLKIKDHEKVEHHQAFDALKKAAKKAIDQGKTETMLNTLKTDAQQDAKMKKLAIGHQEWYQIIQALEQKNASLLN